MQKPEKGRKTSKTPLPVARRRIKMKTPTTKIHKDVPFVVKWGGIEETVRDDILVHPPPIDGANLLGTRAMRKLKQLKMKST